MSTVNPLDQLRRRIGSGSAPVAFAALAEEHRRAGRLDEAVAVCRDGLERYPAYVSARVTLGRALLDLGSVREAVLELESAVEQSPDNLAAARVLTDARNRLAEMPPADVEETTEPLVDTAARGVDQEATDYGDVTAAFQDVAVGDIADHAGLWLMPMTDETGPTSVVGEWHEPSAEPTEAGTNDASSWDDETIYAPVAPVPANGQDPGLEDAGASVESLAAEEVGAADTGLDADSPLASPGQQWALVETAEPREPPSADDAQFTSALEENNAAPPVPDRHAWGDVETGVDQWGGDSSASPWFADEAMLETAEDASTGESTADAGFATPAVEVAPEAEVEDIAEVPAPDAMSRPPSSAPDVAPPGDWQQVSSLAEEAPTVEDAGDAMVPGAQPQVPVPTETPSEARSPWASLLEAAVDEVFADAASPDTRAADPPAGLDYTAIATASASEYDDATVQSLQKLLAAVRARRAELGLLR